MVHEPCVKPVASPALAMVAIAVFDELQLTVLVKFWVLLSVYVPVAVNCCVVPAGMDPFAGVTATETNAAAATVRVVEPVTDPETAWMVDEPWVAPLANPLLDIVATPLFEELHVTVFVRFWVLL